jgi:chitinase
MAFANSSLFNSDYPAQFQPFESLEKMRKRFGPDTKIMIAIGGWGDTSGFSEGAKDEVSRTRYVMNVAAVLSNLGFDGVGEYLSTVTDTEKVD